jgi:outer membrane protein OmpA-like peptidoglycan-associated protein
MTIQIVSSFAVCELYAQEVRFETTSEGIVKGLTRSWKKPPTDTVVPLPNDSKRSTEMRKITVVKKKEGKDVKEEIVVSDTGQIPSVNLKILFDHDSYQIRPESYDLLTELGEALTGDALQDKRIVINGHTDSDGSDAYNLKLSANRALSVKNYLVGNYSIDKDRLKVVGCGEALPLAANTTPANKQINRRVEIQAE